MTLEELLRQHGSQPESSVPQWMLGCFRRHCISFANGESDTDTSVFWLQSRNLTIDLRLPRVEERVPARALADCTADDLHRLSDYEGWLAESHWDGELMHWREATDRQLHTRWPEPAELRRVGNCMIEFAPSGAYVEDWRQLPSGPGPLVGLRLVAEMVLETGQITHRGGGLIICGDYAGLVLGRPETPPTDADNLGEAIRHSSDTADVRAYLAEETSVARGSLNEGFRIQHSTRAERVAQPLIALGASSWRWDGHYLIQTFDYRGETRERTFTVDCLEVGHRFGEATPASDTATEWLQKEAPTLTRYTRPLTGLDLFRPMPVSESAVPDSWQNDRVHIVPASPDWVDLDLEAVQSSRPELLHLFGPDDPWPPQDLSRESDTADLEWHAVEFRMQRSFAYHLLAPDRSRCLGCLYLYPTASAEHDGEGFLWTRSDLDPTIARTIEADVIAWVDSEWPFSQLAWPGRKNSFAHWQHQQLPNYYANNRFAPAPHTAFED